MSKIQNGTGLFSRAARYITISIFILLMKGSALASELPGVSFKGPTTILYSDVLFLTEKYGENFTNILNRASENNDISALIELVRIYNLPENKKGLESTSRLSLIASWTAQAAKAGDLKSMVKLGKLVNAGRGVVASRFLAKRIYQHALDNGYKGAIPQLYKVIAKIKRKKERLQEEANRPDLTEAELVKEATQRFFTKNCNRTILAMRAARRNGNLIGALFAQSIEAKGNACVITSFTHILRFGVKSISLNKCTDGANTACNFNVRWFCTFDLNPAFGFSPSTQNLDPYCPLVRSISVPMKGQFLKNSKRKWHAISMEW